MAKPVVASRCAAEGIDAINGDHFLIAESIDDEARLVGELLQDPERAKRLGQQAQQMIHSHYSWATQLADLPALCGFPATVTVEAAA